MLHFFRTYQKFFFVIIAVVVIFSFSFFGTFNTLANQDSQVPNQVITRAVDGSEITQREMSALYRLVATSPLDRVAWQQGKMPNLMCDGVIQKDLMGTGLAMILARQYFDELRPDLEQRLDRIRHFRSYVHPHAPHLSAASVWQRFLPSLHQQLMVLRTKTDPFTQETLALLFQVYLSQSQLPPDLLRQILVYHQNAQGIEADPLLQQVDLSLFGFQSLEDWFGPRFVELCVQFMMNASLIAEENGYRISNQEVREDLFQNIYTGYRELARQDHLSPEDASRYYQNQLRNLGLDETAALNGWRTVMLFRCLFNDVGNSVSLDPLSFNQFHAFSKESVKVELYELPSYLQLTDLSALFKLQTYSEAVSREPLRNKSILQLPVHLASIDQIEKRTPQLVEQKFELEYTEVNIEELEREISLKQTWDWEVEGSHWGALVKQFPDLFKSNGADVRERYAFLDALSEDERLKVDQFARRQMVKEDPEQLTAALESKTPKAISIGLRGQGGKIPLVSITDQTAFLSLLNDGSEASAARLKCYSQDAVTFYRIDVLKRDLEKHIVAFDQALSDGTLDQMLNKRLEGAYAEVRRKNPLSFQQTDGSWKPFLQVKDQIGRVVYADLLRAIEGSYLAQFGSLPTQGDLPLPSTFYTQYRLLSYIGEAKREIENDPENLKWIEDKGIESQWHLIKTMRTVARGEELGIPKERMFQLADQTWSAVEVGHFGALAFYRVLGREALKEVSAQVLEQAQGLLSIDARRNLMIDLVKQMAEKHAIHLSSEV